VGYLWNGLRLQEKRNAGMEFCETTAVHDELEGLRVIYNEVRNKINATNGSGEKLNLIAQRDRE